MAKFLTGNELNLELEKLFENANNHLIIISPYIKLHDRYKSSLLARKNDPELEITLVFGKNEYDKSKSMNLEDFSFLKEFTNIEIRYEKRLHAKYYANDYNAIITSMNLYNFSQDNNIESGVLTNPSLTGVFTSENSLDKNAWDYFTRVIDQSEVLFAKKPVFENTMFGMKKKYKESIIEKDILSDFFSNRIQNKSKALLTSYKQDEKSSLVSSTKSVSVGYCIRTGKEIPFNTKKPMTEEAYKNWSKFENEDYPEKYCHYSGEASNGETNFSKPILRKNWKKAAETFNL